MSEMENGWHLRSDGYMTSKCSYQRITAFKSNRALDNGGRLVFVKAMGGEEVDSRVYIPHPGTCEMIQHTWMPMWTCSECGKANCGVIGTERHEPPKFCPNCGKRVKR